MAFDTLVKAELSLTIENLGRRPVAIHKVELDITPYTDTGSAEILHFTSDSTIKRENILVQPNNLVNKSVSSTATILTAFPYNQLKA